MKAKIIPWLLIIITVCLPFVFSGCLKQNSGPNYLIDLEIWGVFDDSDVFSKINQEYRQKNPQIKDIRYKKISSDMAQYERELFDALASEKGPDVFMFHNTWLPSHIGKIAPLPESAAKLAIFKENFIDVAYQDFVSDNQIYSMPLYCDTLALYYNKDLFNQAGIPSPPRTWQEVLNNTNVLTKIDSYGNIEQSAIAMGRSKEPGGINRSSDVLMLLMLQGGAKMFDSREKQATFDRSLTSTHNPGENALDFYTSFSRGSSGFYTWNSKMDYSIDSFRFGKTAMMLNYSYLVDRLRKSDPKLNFDVVAAPQLDLNNQVNFANYWGLAVTKRKELLPSAPNQKINYTNDDRIAEAWKYIQYVTAQPQIQSSNQFDPTVEYLEKTKKPAARRDLIELQKQNVDMDVFAWQALTAKSWVQPDTTAVEDIFVDMIDDVVSGKASTADSLRTAASRVNALVRRDFQ